jgi:hypothetical protein
MMTAPVCMNQIQKWMYDAEGRPKIGSLVFLAGRTKPRVESVVSVTHPYIEFVGRTYVLAG